MASVFKLAGSRKYVIMWRDENGKRHKMTGCTDKAESQRIGNDLENQKALRRAGLVDRKAESFRDHEAAPGPIISITSRPASWPRGGRSDTLK